MRFVYWLYNGYKLSEEYLLISELYINYGEYSVEELRSRSNVTSLRDIFIGGGGGQGALAP